MPFYCLQNLTQKSLTTCLPWEWAGERPSEKVCKDKPERQSWYRNPNTIWNFYTGIEPVMNTARVGKDNPPRAIHAFCADYDLPIPDARIDEAVAEMRLKPAWIERSLGGNARLIWPLPAPITTDSYAHALFILQQAESWLSLGLLPGLDSGAFQDPSRLLCNGGNWRSTGHSGISDTDLQAFVVRCGRDFRFSPVSSGNDIPLEVVEKAIREKFPNFAWPSDFSIDSQGPSWWVEGSTSPMSAIVKPEGMFTFSDHAGKPFWAWSEILGPEFTRSYADSAMSEATKDIFFDGKNYWMKIKGIYKSCSDKVMGRHFKVTCGLSSKPDKSGASPVEHALTHLDHEGRVDGAAPFLFRPMGRIEFMGNPVLNISSCSVVQPAIDDSGDCSYVDEYLTRLYINDVQYDHWRAWLKHFYISGLEQKPRPGQAIFLVGKPGIGKGLCSHEIVGYIMGGFTDGSAYLVHGDNFGSENFHKALITLDDESSGGSFTKHAHFESMVKKVVANQEHKYHMKFQVPCMVEWSGRVMVSLNMDYTSTRIMVSMDNSNFEKVSIFRCTDDESIKALFSPDREALRAKIRAQIPTYLRKRILNWTVPDYVAIDNRFGYASYHDKDILDQSHQTSKSAPFKEMLLEELANYFQMSPEAKEWRGTITQLVRMMSVTNPDMVRRMNLDNVNRYVEQIAKEGLVRCRCETGAFKTRVWIFERPEFPPTPEAKPLSIFSK